MSNPLDMSSLICHIKPTHTHMYTYVCVCVFYTTSYLDFG